MGTAGITFTNPLINASGNNQAYTVNSTGGGVLTLGGYAASNSGTSFTGTFNGNANVLISGSVTNGSTSTAGTITYSGTGTLTLQGANTYGGNTTVNSGTIIAVSAPGTSPSATMRAPSSWAAVH